MELQPRGGAPIGRLLRRHALRRPAAAIVAQVGEALGHQTAATGVELAATFDLQTGDHVGALVTGARNDVTVADHIRAMLPGRLYVAIHTHPASSSFSDDDVITLVANDPLQCIAVIGADGTWYVMSKLPGRPHASARVVQAALRAAVTVLVPSYLAAVRTGDATREEALREMLHDIWQSIAPLLGLRYDRLRDEGDVGR